MFPGWLQISDFFEENKEFLMILGKIWNLKVVVDYFFFKRIFLLVESFSQRSEKCDDNLMINLTH